MKTRTLSAIQVAIVLAMIAIVATVAVVTRSPGLDDGRSKAGFVAEKQDPGTIPPGLVEVPVESLFAAADKDKDGTAKRFDTRWIIVAGAVKDIRPIQNDGAEITLTGSGIGNVTCLLDAPNVAIIPKVEVGDNVRIAGIGVAVARPIAMLSDCRIVPADYVSAKGKL